MNKSLLRAALLCYEMCEYICKGIYFWKSRRKRECIHVCMCVCACVLAWWCVTTPEVRKRKIVVFKENKREMGKTRRK